GRLSVQVRREAALQDGHVEGRFLTSLRLPSRRVRGSRCPAADLATAPHDLTGVRPRAWRKPPFFLVCSSATFSIFLRVSSAFPDAESAAFSAPSLATFAASSILATTRGRTSSTILS